MVTLISGIVAAISGLVFLFSLVISSGPQTAKVGDVFVHANPGMSDDPTRAPDSFTQIYSVEEVRDGKARVKKHTVYLNGRTIEYEEWSLAYGLGKFDKKIGEAKP